MAWATFVFMDYNFLALLFPTASAEFEVLFIFPPNIPSLWRERIDFWAECYQEYYHLYKHIQPILTYNVKTYLSMFLLSQGL